MFEKMFEKALKEKRSTIVCLTEMHIIFPFFQMDKPWPYMC